MPASAGEEIEGNERMGGGGERGEADVHVCLEPHLRKGNWAQGQHLYPCLILIPSWYHPCHTRWNVPILSPTLSDQPVTTNEGGGLCPWSS